MEAYFSILENQKSKLKNIRDLEVQIWFKNRASEKNKKKQGFMIFFLKKISLFVRLNYYILSFIQIIVSLEVKKKVRIPN